MMRVEDISPRIAVLFLAVILVFIAFYLVLMRVDNYLKYSAIDGCARSARFERREGNGIISYPIDAFYKDCLAKKGI